MPPSAEKSNVVGTSGVTIGGAVAQVRRQRRGIDDLAGIEQIVRIERALDLAEGLIQGGAEHLLLKRTAHQAVAVFAGEGAAVLEHQVGDFVGDRLELLRRPPRSSN